MDRPRLFVFDFRIAAIGLTALCVAAVAGCTSGQAGDPATVETRRAATRDGSRPHRPEKTPGRLVVPDAALPMAVRQAAVSFEDPPLPSLPSDRLLKEEERLFSPRFAPQPDEGRFDLLKRLPDPEMAERRARIPVHRRSPSDPPEPAEFEARDTRLPPVEETPAEETLADDSPVAALIAPELSGPQLEPEKTSPPTDSPIHSEQNTAPDRERPGEDPAHLYRLPPVIIRPAVTRREAGEEVNRLPEVDTPDSDPPAFIAPRPVSTVPQTVPQIQPPVAENGALETTVAGADTAVPQSDLVDLAPPQTNLPADSAAAPTREDPRFVDVTLGSDTQSAAMPPASPLAGPSPVDRQMHVIRQQARAHLYRAVSLVGRGATYSAREELIAGLRVITQALDAAENTQEHGQALSAGLTALEEAEDFLPQGTSLEVDLNIDHLVAGHRTPVLQHEREDAQRESELTSLVARQRYYTFARERLTTAGGRELTASEILYALGRLQSAGDTGSPAGESAAAYGPAAMTMYQAALAIDPQNSMAANELGVLLYRYGQYEQAVAALTHSAHLSPQPETWHNLAVVYERMGQADGAKWARGQWQMAQNRRRAASQSVVQAQSGAVVEWLDAATFAHVSGNVADPALAAPINTAGTSQNGATSRPAGSSGMPPTAPVSTPARAAQNPPPSSWWPFHWSR